MDYNLSNKSFQFMLFQNKAYDEERLIQLKSNVDNKINDFSHILERNQPSRRTYLEREKQKEIQSQNHHLLNKIHSIIYQRNQKENGGGIRLPKSVEQKILSKAPTFHPFSDDNKGKSMNINIRMKEMDRINDDNRLILSKLQATKPTINLVDLKVHAKNSKKYGNRLRSFDSKHRPKSILCIFDRSKLNPILSKFIARHETKDDVDVKEVSKKYNEIIQENNLNDNLASIAERHNEDQIDDSLLKSAFKTRAVSSQIHRKPNELVTGNFIITQNQSTEDGEQEKKTGHGNHKKLKKRRNFPLKPIPGQADSYQEYYKDILSSNNKIGSKRRNSQTLSPIEHKKEDLIMSNSVESSKVLDESIISKKSNNLSGYDLRGVQKIMRMKD